MSCVKVSQRRRLWSRSRKVALVLRGVEHNSSRARKNAVAAGFRLVHDGKLAPKVVIELLTSRLVDANYDVRRASVAALRKLGA